LNILGNHNIFKVFTGKYQKISWFLLIEIKTFYSKSTSYHVTYHITYPIEYNYVSGFSVYADGLDSRPIEHGCYY